MTDDNDFEGDSGSLIDWPRRNVLKLAGVGVAGLGGAMAATATEGDSDDEKTDGGKDDEKDEKDDDEHFISDLADPTFGYPLAADETDDLDLKYVVNVTREEGMGAHPRFPTEDFGEPPGEGEGGESESTPASVDPPETPTEMDVTPSGPSEIPAGFFFDPVGLWVKPCLPSISRISSRCTPSRCITRSSPSPTSSS